MTIRELKESVAALCFIATYELDRSFIIATNRAKRIIETRHPKIKRCSLGFYPEEPIYKRDLITSASGDVKIPVPIGTLKMRLHGDGKYIAIDGKKRREVTFSYSQRDVKIEFAEGGELIFLGGGSYSASGIEVYRKPDKTYSEAVEMVGDYRIIDLTEIFPDMLYLTENPVGKNGVLIPHLAVLDGTHIMLLKSYKGEISLCYRAAGEPVLSDDESLEIDLSPELSELLPTLVAHYLLLSDEPDLAERYFDDFKDMSYAIKRAKPITKAALYVDTTGWAR